MSDHQKAAIVTGAGRGLGLAAARELHARGYRLALLSPSGAAEVAARELGAIGRTGSVTNQSDLAALVVAAHSTFGRIDAVVNSTGNAPVAPAASFSTSQFTTGTPAPTWYFSTLCAWPAW